MQADHEDSSNHCLTGYSGKLALVQMIFGFYFLIFGLLTTDCYNFLDNGYVHQWEFLLCRLPFCMQKSIFIIHNISGAFYTVNLLL